MPKLHAAFRNGITTFYSWLIRVIGREWIDYLVSNTMNAGLQRLNKFLWTYDCKAIIVAVIRETPTTKTFVLLPNQHFSTALPGQHTELSMTVDDEIIKRCYTLSMISEDRVAITVKQQNDGKLSGWLHEHARVGMELNISSPRGRFAYEGHDKLIFICAGSGITPCFSLINQFDGTSPSPHISMYYRSRSAADTIFRERLEQHSQIDQLKLCYSQDKPQLSNEEFEATLSGFFPDLLNSAVYLCGPAGFRDRVLSYLEKTGFAMNQLYMENFAPVTKACNQPDKLWTGDAVVHLSAQNQSFLMTAADSGKTLLETAEANGIKMVHGCRSGMCGTCKTIIISGDIIGAKLGNTIYPCVSYPASAEIVLQ